MNWWWLIYLVPVVVFLWVVLSRAADAKRLGWMGQAGRRLESMVNYREMRYRRMVAFEVSAAMDLILPRMTYDLDHPRDDVVAWLVSVETENRAARSFIRSDRQRTSEWLKYFDSWRSLNKPTPT